MNPFDLWDQATITSIVRESTDLILGNQDRVAPMFAVQEPTSLRKISKARIKLKAVGKGRGVLADDATPPIYRPELRFTEEAFSLMRLGEMTPVEESLRAQLELNGTDPESLAQRDRAGADIVTRIRAIAVRQENLSDWLVMQAVLNGQLQVKVANPPGSPSTMTDFLIDYEYPTGAITQAPTSFDQVGAKPVDVLKAAQQQVKNTCGRYGTDFAMSSELWNMIVTHPDTIARFNFNAQLNFNAQVTEDMLKSLLWDRENITFHITDSGWFDEAAGYGSSEFGFLDADKTRWIPKDTFITWAKGNAISSAGASTQAGGQPFADGTPDPDPFMSMYDGKVWVPTAWNNGEYRGPGAQTFQKLDLDNGTMFYRWEARRFPMIHHPERVCVVKAQF